MLEAISFALRFINFSLVSIILPSFVLWNWAEDEAGMSSVQISKNMSFVYLVFEYLM